MTDTHPTQGRTKLARWGTGAWYLIGIAIALYIGLVILEVIAVVAIAIVVAMFLGAVLWKPALWLQHKGVPQALSAFLVLGAALAVFAGLVALVSFAVAGNFDDLSASVVEAGESLRSWLIDGPLGLTDEQIDTTWERLRDAAGSTSASLLGGATAAFEVVGGLFLMLMVTFFILKDGERMVAGLLARLPEGKSERVAVAIQTGWSALARYMAGLAIVGLVDAVLIGIGLVVLGVPLALPLSVLVFIGAFFPLIGAFLSGLLAVGVAFVSNGAVDALIVLGVVTAIQQVEGDVLMPMVFGRTLQLHPLVILVSLAVGGVAFGIIGAFLAVPIVAVAVAVRQALADDPEATFTALAQGVEIADPEVH